MPANNLLGTMLGGVGGQLGGTIGNLAGGLLGPAGSIYNFTQGNVSPAGVLGLGAGLSSLGSTAAGALGASGLAAGLSSIASFLGPVGIIVALGSLIAQLAQEAPPNQSELASSLLAQMVSPAFRQAGVTGRQGGGRVRPEVGRWQSGGYFGSQPWGGAILPAAMRVNAPFAAQNVPGMNVARAGSILGRNLTAPGVSGGQQQDILRSLTGGSLESALQNLVQSYATGGLIDDRRVFNQRFAQDFPNLFGALAASNTGPIGLKNFGTTPQVRDLSQTIADEIFRTSGSGLLNLYGVPQAQQGDLLSQLLSQAQQAGMPYAPGGMAIPTGFDPAEYGRRLAEYTDLTDRMPSGNAIALQYIQELQNALAPTSSTPPTRTATSTTMFPSLTPVDQRILKTKMQRRLQPGT